MIFLRNFAAFFGRVFIALLFLRYAIHQVLDFSGTEGLLASRGIGAPSFFAAVGILAQLVGGIFLFLGYRTQLGAFLILAAWMPAVWLLCDGLGQWKGQMMFLKNLAILGGVLMIFASGPGAWNMQGSGGGSSKGE